MINSLESVLTIGKIWAMRFVSFANSNRKLYKEYNMKFCPRICRRHGIPSSRTFDFQKIFIVFRFFYSLILNQKMLINRFWLNQYRQKLLFALSHYCSWNLRMIQNLLRLASAILSTSWICVEIHIAVFAESQNSDNQKYTSGDTNNENKYGNQLKCLSELNRDKRRRITIYIQLSYLLVW